MTAYSDFGCFWFFFNSQDPLPVKLRYSETFRIANLFQKNLRAATLFAIRVSSPGEYFPG